MLSSSLVLVISICNSHVKKWQGVFSFVGMKVFHVSNYNATSILQVKPTLLSQYWKGHCLYQMIMLKMFLSRSCMKEEYYLFKVKTKEDSSLKAEWLWQELRIPLRAWIKSFIYINAKYTSVKSMSETWGRVEINGRNGN